MITQVRLRDLVPYQFGDPIDLALVIELAESIRLLGQLSPLWCADDGHRYAVINGLHRLFAMYKLADENAPGWTPDTLVSVEVDVDSDLNYYGGR